MRLSPFCLWLVALVIGSVVGPAYASIEGTKQVSSNEGRVNLSVEGISGSSGEDEPRVLYILPWQAPTLPRRPRADLTIHAPNIEHAVDPWAIERHRMFRHSLNPLTLSPLGGQSPM